jgi:hypothetical protein
MSESRLMRAALASAERGLFVFPLEPRTKDQPLTPHGFKDASTNPAHIRRWWTRCPEANLGLWPGPSKLVVLDSDGPAGAETLATFGITSETTVTVETGRGRHFYFRHPGGVSVGNKKLGDHVDVRADRGYTVLPPSLHPSGRRYSWFRISTKLGGDARSICELVDLPPAVLATLTAPPPAPVPSPGELRLLPRHPEVLDDRVLGYLAAVGPRPEGDRNRTAFIVAAWLRRDMALGEQDAWCWLTLWNQHNVPPLDGYELAKCFQSAARYGRRPVGTALMVSR